MEIHISLTQRPRTDARRRCRGRSFARAPGRDRHGNVAAAQRPAGDLDRGDTVAAAVGQDAGARPNRCDRVPPELAHLGEIEIVDPARDGGDGHDQAPDPGFPFSQQKGAFHIHLRTGGHGDVAELRKARFGFSTLAVGPAAGRERRRGFAGGDHAGEEYRGDGRHEAASRRKTMFGSTQHGFRPRYSEEVYHVGWSWTGQVIRPIRLSLRIEFRLALGL